MSKCFHYGVLLKIEVSSSVIEWHGKGQCGQLALKSVNAVSCTHGAIQLLGDGLFTAITIPDDSDSYHVTHDLFYCINKVQSGVFEDLEE